MKLKLLYILIALLACLIYGWLSYSTLSVLDSKLDPSIILVRYKGYHALLFLTTVLFYLVLMVISNVLYVKESKGFYFLFSALIFIAFTLFFHIHIKEEYYQFKQQLALWNGGFYSGYIYGFFYSLIAVILTTGNYLIMLFFVKPRIRSGY